MSIAHDKTSSFLIKFQIGPVQEFIAQARSTRDLWSGSYLLSWLVAAGIRKLLECPGASLVYPATNEQPLLHRPFDLTGGHKLLLTPNLPNVFIGSVPAAHARLTAAAIEKAMREEWAEIAKAVWKNRALFCFSEETQDLEKQCKRFFSQVESHLSVSWVVTPETGDYPADYSRAGWQLDAVRQTREFKAWAAGGWQTGGMEKDSLSGREEALVGGKDWLEKVGKTPRGYLFKHPDPLGAVNLVKRVWHLCYLKDCHGLKTASHEFVIRSTRGIAARELFLDDEDGTDTASGEKYLAAIAFDGDSIGSWVSGSRLPSGTDLRAYHTRFSQSLGDFALGSARRIVEDHRGFLVYAGGDDVLALVPADAALTCAKELRNAFCQAMKEVKGQDPARASMEELSPDASAGIAIAHFKAPLQDLIREARKAEKKAKNQIQRAAFFITLIKRSGEIDEWGAKWESGGVALYDALAELLRKNRLSQRFPHRVCALLSPYLTGGNSPRPENDVPGFDAGEVIRLEFSHAAQRQGGPDVLSALEELLRQYLSRVVGGPQASLRAVIGLCKALAFAERNRPADFSPSLTTAERPSL